MKVTISVRERAGEWWDAASSSDQMSVPNCLWHLFGWRSAADPESLVVPVDSVSVSQREAVKAAEWAEQIHGFTWSSPLRFDGLTRETWATLRARAVLREAGFGLAREDVRLDRTGPDWVHKAEVTLQRAGFQVEEFADELHYDSNYGGLLPAGGVFTVREKSGVLAPLVEVANRYAREWFGERGGFSDDGAGWGACRGQRIVLRGEKVAHDGATEQFDIERLLNETLDGGRPEPGRVVVTRHPALLDYLVETGHCSPGDPVIAHAMPDDVRGKHVIGVLPHHLSCLAASVTEVQLDIPPDLRGVELTVEQVREFARGVRRYEVREVEAQVGGEQ